MELTPLELEQLKIYLCELKETTGKTERPNIITFISNMKACEFTKGEANYLLKYNETIKSHMRALYQEEDSIEMKEREEKLNKDYSEISSFLDDMEEARRFITLTSLCLHLNKRKVKVKEFLNKFPELKLRISENNNMVQHENITKDIDPTHKDKIITFLTEMASTTTKIDNSVIALNLGTKSHRVRTILKIYPEVLALLVSTNEKIDNLRYRVSYYPDQEIIDQVKSKIDYALQNSINTNNKNLSELLGFKQKEVRHLLANCEELSTYKKETNNYISEKRREILLSLSREKKNKKLVSEIQDFMEDMYDAEILITFKKIKSELKLSYDSLNSLFDENPCLQELMDELNLALNEERQEQYQRYFDGIETEKLSLSQLHEIIRNKSRGRVISEFFFRQQLVKYKIPFDAESFRSRVICNLVHENGILTKEICLYISSDILAQVGFKRKIDFITDGKANFGIFPSLKGIQPDRESDHVKIVLAWKPGLCKEPVLNESFYIKLNTVFTKEKNGFWFVLPNEFFLNN